MKYIRDFHCIHVMESEKYGKALSEKEALDLAIRLVKLKKSENPELREIGDCAFK